MDTPLPDSTPVAGSTPQEVNFSRWAPLVVMMGWVLYSVFNNHWHSTEIKSLRDDVNEIRAQQMIRDGKK